MAGGNRVLRPLSLGRPVHSGRRDDDLHRVPERVPEHVVAPDGDGSTEGTDTPLAQPDVLKVALVVPLKHWAAAFRDIAKGVRIVKPSEWGGRVELYVLPDLGPEFVDFDQYETPEAILTLRALVEP
jgi:hypothetical protein